MRLYAQSGLGTAFFNIPLPCMRTDKNSISLRRLEDEIAHSLSAFCSIPKDRSSLGVTEIRTFLSFSHFPDPIWVIFVTVC